MTKKDYIAFAAIVKQLGICNTCKYQVALGLASCFIMDNSRFDDAKFFAACGVELEDQPQTLGDA